MTGCCIIGCKRRSDDRKERGVTFHRFPKNPEARNAWIEAVGRGDDWRPSNCTIVCSLHFDEDCFDKTRQHVRLLPGSVPTLIDRKHPDYMDQRENCQPPQKENTENLKSSESLSTLPPGSAHIVRVVLEPSADNKLEEQDNSPVKESQHEGPGKRKREADDYEKRNVKPRKGRQSNVLDDNTLLSDLLKLVPESSENVGCVPQSEIMKLVLGVAESCNTPSGNFKIVQISPAASQSVESVVEVERHCEELPDDDDDNKDSQLKLCNLEVLKLRNYCVKLKKKIKLLLQQRRRDAKRIAALQDSIDSLKRQRYIDKEKSEILSNVPPPLIELLERQRCKRLGKAVTKEYSPTMRNFVNTLYAISPRAYKYVRGVFDACIPHPRTLTKWKPKDHNGQQTLIDQDNINEQNEEEDNVELHFTNEEIINEQNAADKQDNVELHFAIEEIINEQNAADKQDNVELHFTDKESNNNEQNAADREGNVESHFTYKESNNGSDFSGDEDNIELYLSDEESNTNELDFTDDEGNS